MTRPKKTRGAEPEDVLCQKRSRKNHFNFKVTDHYKTMPNILLMEEIPNNHLECIKPCRWWDKLLINWLAGFLPTVCEAIAKTSTRNPKFDSEVDMKSSFYSKISPAVKPMGNETPKVVSCDILLQVPWFMVAKLTKQVSFGFSLAVYLWILGNFLKRSHLFCFCVQISAKTQGNATVTSFQVWWHGTISSRIPKH